MRTQTIVAIIQTTLYVPGLAVSLYILVRNWRNRPRQAWYPMVPFTIFRLIGGIDVICLDRNPDSIPMITIALITLGVGLIPLIVSILGIIRTILHISNDNDDIHLMHRIIRGLRAVFGIAVGLLISGGSLVTSSDTASIGRALTQAGYVVFSCVILVESAMLWKLRGYTIYLAGNGSLIYFWGASLTMPLLLLRASYSLLSEFKSQSLYSEWNPLFGSSIAFGLMALLPEYIVLIIIMYLGYHRIKQGKGAV